VSCHDGFGASDKDQYGCTEAYDYGYADGLAYEVMLVNWGCDEEVVEEYGDYG
jgi:hypothetical protein